MVSRTFLIITVLLVVFSCKPSGEKGDRLQSVGAENLNLYSELFTIEHHDDFNLLVLRKPWQGAGDVSFEYLLCGSPDSVYNNYPVSRRIITPVSKVVCMSTTHIAMIDYLGESESIVGVSGINYVSNTAVRKRIGMGQVKEIGYDSNLNTEMIASLDPDLVIAYGIGPESSAYLAKLDQAGIPVLYISEYLETDPLARAEWIKVFGLIFEKEKEAEAFFEQSAGEYEVFRQRINQAIKSRPVVMTGLPYKDSWFISPGNSYISRIISDAGGKYLWENNKSEVSMPMSFESVFIKAREADIWINAGSAASLEDILSVDNRLGELPCVVNGQVYNNIKQLNSYGGNGYWESGAIAPQTILMDLASIFHPEVFYGYEKCYYISLQ